MIRIQSVIHRVISQYMDSFSGLSKKDYEWVMKGSMVFNEVKTFPKSCGRMIAVCMAIPVVILFGTTIVPILGTLGIIYILDTAPAIEVGIPFVAVIALLIIYSVLISIKAIFDWARVLKMWFFTLWIGINPTIKLNHFPNYAIDNGSDKSIEYDLGYISRAEFWRSFMENTSDSINDKNKDWYSDIAINRLFKIFNHLRIL